MSGITPYSPSGGNVSGAAADIAARLGLLRTRLAGLDADLLQIPPSQLADLLAGYDIYARMLDDALHDIARDLQRQAAAHDQRQAAAHDPQPRAETPRRSDVELAGSEAR